MHCFGESLRATFSSFVTGAPRVTAVTTSNNGGLTVAQGRGAGAGCGTTLVPVGGCGISCTVGSLASLGTKGV